MADLEITVVNWEQFTALLQYGVATKQAQSVFRSGSLQYFLDVQDHQLRIYLAGSETPIFESTAQVQSDWNATEGMGVILNKPTLAAVATSGNYNDLTNKPTIPAAQVQSDWTATSGIGAILNKPVLAAVATSGSYNDLSDKPTITPVSGVNDGTNWTSITIGNTTKAIPSGGGGGGGMPIIEVNGTLPTDPQESDEIQITAAQYNTLQTANAILKITDNSEPDWVSSAYMFPFMSADPALGEADPALGEPTVTYEPILTYAAVTPGMLMVATLIADEDEDQYYIELGCQDILSSLIVKTDSLPRADEHTADFEQIGTTLYHKCLYEGSVAQYHGDFNGSKWMLQQYDNDDFPVMFDPNSTTTINVNFYADNKNFTAINIRTGSRLATDISKVLGITFTEADTGTHWSYYNAADSRYSEYLRNIQVTSAPSNASSFKNLMAEIAEFNGACWYEPLNSIATTTKAGLMSATDKTKLDGLGQEVLSLGYDVGTWVGNNQYFECALDLRDFEAFIITFNHYSDINGHDAVMSYAFTSAQLANGTRIILGSDNWACDFSFWIDTTRDATGKTLGVYTSDYSNSRGINLRKLVGLK